MTSDGRKVVLLAEDDPAQREVLQEVLEYEGYQVAPADGPAEVLRRLAERPDVVLLDLVGVASPEVMRAVESLGASRPALLLVSGDSGLADVAERLPVDGYVAKPYDMEELLAGIARALERRAPDAESCWAPAP